MNKIAKAEGLDLTASAPKKRMHQKYIIHKNSATVVTGTANMTQDAYQRHSEHRIRLVGNKPIAEAFYNDFTRIKSFSEQVRNK